MKTITSRDNPLIKRLHALAHAARDRRQLGETVLDGAHLVEAAVQAHWPLKAIVCAESGLTHPEHQRLLDAIAADVPRYQLPDALFRHVSPVDTPSGVLAIIDLPPSAAPERLTDSVVVLDAVQDPGNLGITGQTKPRWAKSLKAHGRLTASNSINGSKNSTDVFCSLS